MSRGKKFIVSFFCIVVVGLSARSWLSTRYVVPIMMYHHVEDTVQGRSDTVSPENFRQHMQYLQDKGYRPINLEDLVQGIKNGQKFPARTVVVTFDDGYVDNYTYAFPVLKELKIPATLFIAPEDIGQQGFLSWEQILAMQKSGVIYGSHGMSQAYLPDLSLQQQQYEIKSSKDILEQKLGSRIDFFAYPVGGFDHLIKRQIKSAGYAGALTTNRGFDRFNKDTYELNRIRFSDKDNTDIILWAKLSGYYNMFRRLKKPF